MVFIYVYCLIYFVEFLCLSYVYSLLEINILSYIINNIFKLLMIIDLIENFWLVKMWLWLIN